MHRRADLSADNVTCHRGIPVTSLVSTLVDLAARLPRRQLEPMINEADKFDLIDPETLRTELDRRFHRRPGAPALRKLLDRATFRLTDSELERLFLAHVRRAGLTPPETGRWVNGFKVDFFWPELGLIVETDGLRYHRTAAQQTRGHVRDQIHLASEHIPLRFSHAQVAFDAGHVEATLRRVARRLQKAA